MSDIQHRLRASVRMDAVHGDTHERSVCARQMVEAADEIERLTRELTEAHARVAHVEMLERIAATGTVENWLLLSNEAKRLSFALLIDESSRRKRAEDARDEHARWRAKLADDLHDRETEIIELRRQLAEAEQDARRYRWLRNEANTARKCDPMVCIYPLDEQDLIDGDRLDAAIDAAMGASNE